MRDSIDDKPAVTNLHPIVAKEDEMSLEHSEFQKEVIIHAIACHYFHDKICRHIGTHVDNQTHGQVYVNAETKIVEHVS